MVVFGECNIGMLKDYHGNHYPEVVHSGFFETDREKPPPFSFLGISTGL